MLCIKEGMQKEKSTQKTRPFKGFANRIDEHMTEYPSFASRKTPVKEAAEFMEQMGFRHLPVLEGVEVVGIVSQRDLRQAVLFSKEIKLTLEDVMTREPYVVTTEARLATVVNEMADRKIGSAIVLDPDRRVAGIFTTTDAMKILGQVLERDSEGKLSIEKYLSWNTLI